MTPVKMLSNTISSEIQIPNSNSLSKSEKVLTNNFMLNKPQKRAKRVFNMIPFKPNKLGVKK